MKVVFKAADIVDELVCPGNIQLNMSGGINGELLLRYGDAMHKQLHDYLQRTGKRCVDPGFVMTIGDEVTHFECVVYAVAVDAFYDSSIEIVADALVNALRILECKECKTIAVPALATGYGHLSKTDFGHALKQCLASREWTFNEICVVLRHSEDCELVENALSGA